MKQSHRLSIVCATLFLLGLQAPVVAAQQFAQPPQALLDTILRWLLSALIFLANFAGGLIVGVAILRGLGSYVLDLARKRGGEIPKEGIRLSLGRSLALALEFQVGADILGTALDPSLQDIATLGAIVVLRTVLNYFLGRELRESAERQPPE